MSSSQEKKLKKQVKFTDGVQVYYPHGQEQYFEHMNELVESIHESDSQSVVKLKSVTDEFERISSLNKEIRKAIEELKEKLFKVKQEEQLASQRNVEVAERISATQLKFQKLLQERDELQSLASSATELAKNNSIDEIARLNKALENKLDKRLREQKHAIDGAREELNYTRESYERKIGALRRELEQARTAAAKMKADVGNGKSEVEVMKKSISEIEAANERKIQEIVATETELQKEAEEIEQLKLKEDEMRAQHQLEQLDLNEKIENISDRRTKLEEEVQMTVLENDKLKQEQTALHKRKLELQEGVAKTVSEIAAVEGNVEELRKEAAEELVGYNNSVEGRSNEIERLQGLLEKETEFSADYEKKLADLNQAIAQQTQKSSEVTAQIQAAETHKANVLAEIASLSSQLQSLDVTIESERKSMDETELKMKYNAEKLNEMKETYVREQDEFEKAYSELELSLSQEYELQETQYKDGKEQLEKEIEKLISENKELESQLRMFMFLNESLF